MMNLRMLLKLSGLLHSHEGSELAVVVLPEAPFMCAAVLRLVVPKSYDGAGPSGIGPIALFKAFSCNGVSASEGLPDLGLGARKTTTSRSKLLRA